MDSIIYLLIDEFAEPSSSILAASTDIQDIFDVLTLDNTPCLSNLSILGYSIVVKINGNSTDYDTICISEDMYEYQLKYPTPLLVHNLDSSQYHDVIEKMKTWNEKLTKDLEEQKKKKEMEKQKKKEDKERKEYERLKAKFEGEDK